MDGGRLGPQADIVCIVRLRAIPNGHCGPVAGEQLSAATARVAQANSGQRDLGPGSR